MKNTAKLLESPFLLVIAFAVIIVAAVFLNRYSMPGLDRNQIQDEARKTQSSATKANEPSGGIESDSVATQEEKTSQSESEYTNGFTGAPSRYSIYGVIKKAIGTTETTRPIHEIQYEVDVATATAHKIGSHSNSIVVSDLRCSMNQISNIPNLYYFTGVVYNPEYGWYNCSSASPAFGGGQ